MSAPRGNALIGQSGGPTCVINQSLVGLVEAAREAGQIEHVYGAVHGIAGVLAEDLIDLGRESQATLEAVAQTPCAALRSVRKKPTREECERVLQVLKAHDVRYFFYIGGNDSAETAHILNELAVAEDYEVRLFHVPKTIDNDLRVTDHCPGYGSAARFVACALMGDDQDNRSLPGIKIDVIMGRHAGWLTAAGALARTHEDAGPHLIYLPERVFDVDSFLGDVDRVHSRLGRCLIAVSEGIHDAEGNPIGATSEKDSHGNVQLSGSGALGDRLAALVKDRLGSKLRVRADTFGYLQRSFAGFASEVDQREAREVGRKAVEVATRSDTPHGSIVITREGDGREYRAGFECTELGNVAKATRDLDAGFLKGTNDVDPSFLDYVRPLVGAMPVPGRLSDFPVEKRLG
jgi:6-phosphofructokinase 1